ncbi:hypothetical protein RhiirA4_465339 [Rhizophagus irregularis]|uniref:Ion transport domain-containing protein n=1 Tax=Rhizophagus irregularis TaxID=588596 RepID=A0A2I1GRY1_9GLOM|nr:hypothetical protein RhiirA4_465339 [Rhizophagus irregularis]
MIPYIKFVNYPKKYNWFLELIRPQSSPIIKTISKDIYKTWNGEVLINFKWNTYGKYYYIIIWIGFLAFLGCFTVAASIPLDENIKKNLLISSIILGSFHLIREFRQFIYNPIKWIYNYWNFFDIGAYLIPTGTSIYWLFTNNKITSWLSFSCLLLDIKFLLFFRVFESFEFNNNDPNNPWNLTTIYNQINQTEDGTLIQNASFIQIPDENTNMFTETNKFKVTQPRICHKIVT